MSYRIRKAEIFYNRHARLTARQIQEKTGCDIIMGGWLFNNHPKSKDYLTPCNWCRVRGYTHTQDEYNDWCLVVGEDGKPVMSTDKTAPYVLSGVPVLKDGQRLYRKLDPAVARPASRQAIGWDKDGRVIPWFETEILTREELQEKLLAIGAVDALMLDGGGSTQGISPDARTYSSRTLATFICMWIEEGTMGKKTVCLDAGHDGYNLANKSPDGGFYEHEFALDVSKRLQRLLEAAGVRVVLTRPSREKVSLQERCRISNRENADLFVSLHTNAVSGGWNDARGWEVYCYGGGEGQRAAEAVAKAVESVGVRVRGVKENPTLYVLKHTRCPAILIEHGFHTNQEDVALMKQPSYRQMLAQAEADGILVWLGMKQVEPEKPVTPPTAPTEMDRAVKWITETGIMRGGEDGNLMLEKPLTRGQFAVMLWRYHERFDEREGN